MLRGPGDFQKAKPIASPEGPPPEVTTTPTMSSMMMVKIYTEYGQLCSDCEMNGDELLP